MDPEEKIVTPFHVTDRLEAFLLIEYLPCVSSLASDEQENCVEQSCGKQFCWNYSNFVIQFLAPAAIFGIDLLILFWPGLCVPKAVETDQIDMGCSLFLCQ